ncbi:MAG: NADP-dependent malic enzyme [Proteobacteria bacterium]|nr:MAG: NADP-dependent malic enzyme [Pseudomonadota bacterium]
MSKELDDDALEYHRCDPPGKLAIVATKPMATQRDLALAYSPGVAAACREIALDPTEVSSVTARGNLVAVITNGTAVLGLGAIGALAAKPVMEGKAVLFKKFSGIDVFDIEINEYDPQKFVDVVATLEPTFGAINLEDIKAPECFEIEKALRERMNIPVFHDDQHGTAIIVSAAIVNGLRVAGKELAKVKLVTSGAGAAALACLDLLVRMGLPRKNITVTDIIGVVYEGRVAEMDPYKARYAQRTSARTLDDVIDGVDIFLGLSAPGVLKADMVKRMAEKPLILALANPVPEIMPDEAKAVRPDVIMATGRSDFPNQVNNVLCFPFIFRGALDVGATTINEEMKLACVQALADLAMAEPSDVVQRAYVGESLTFGPEYLIPKPFDPRLVIELSSAVARAAMDSGVATRPLEDLGAYRRSLSQFVFRSSGVMEPIFEKAKEQPRRLVYAEGEERRVLQAAQQVIDEGLAFPILIGRPDVVEYRLKEFGLRMRAGEDFELVNPLSDPRFREYWAEYHEIMGRKGVSPDAARTVVRTQNTVIAALMVRRGDAHAMLCGTVGPYRPHLKNLVEVIGKAKGVRDVSTLVALILPHGTYFMCDTHVTPNPTSEEIAEMTLLAAEEIRRFGITPKAALLSHSTFGSFDTESSHKMRAAVEILHQRAPELEVDGEMHAEAALSEEIRQATFPASKLKGSANLLIAPNIESAHIAHGLLKMLAGGVSVGPMLLGAAKPAHVVTQSITVRGLVNMSALTVVQAQVESDEVAATKARATRVK